MGVINVRLSFNEEVSIKVYLFKVSLFKFFKLDRVGKVKEEFHVWIFSVSLELVKTKSLFFEQKNIIKSYKIIKTTVKSLYTSSTFWKYTVVRRPGKEKHPEIVTGKQRLV